MATMDAEIAVLKSVNSPFSVGLAGCRTGDSFGAELGATVTGYLIPLP
jgi:hypothetical protein